MNQSYSIGDGIASVAIVAAFFGYFYMKFCEKQRYLEILHQERIAAMDKGIPLPELPIEPLFVKTARPTDFRVVMLIGIVLLFFGIGSMLTIALLPGAQAYWPAPLPVAFIGGALLIAFGLSSRSAFGL